VDSADIQDSRYAEWADQYLAYGDLKKQIKSHLPWNDTAEADFIQALKNELEKCEKFQREKADELLARIDRLEKEVIGLVERADMAEEEPEEEAANGRPGRDARTPGDMERQVDDHRDDDAGSDDEDDDGSVGMSEGSIEERYRELEEEVAILVADVHDLALFTKLNFTGFVKIVKKHDVRVPYMEFESS
jgi:SPX domain protein involved in polyphosphate accumulation